MGRLFLLVFLLFPVALHAQKINVDSLMRAAQKEEHRLPGQMLTLQAGFNAGDDSSVAYEIDYHYFPLRYAGVGFGVELDDNHGDKPLTESDEDDYTYDVDRIVKVNFHPMLSFRSPPVWFSHDRSWGVMLRCDPGVVLSVPANDEIYVTEPVQRDKSGILIASTRTIRNHGGKWFFWRVRTGLSFYNEFVAITVGWGISNYNINYCRNHMENNWHRLYGHDSFAKTNSLFIALSYCF